jgi:glycosyltransferase involved in cell wall biosynthesis
VTQKLRIAAFGFRSLPPRAGAAGADKFALELLPRLAERGHQVVAYNRLYPGDAAEERHSFRRVDVVPLRTVSWKGFDTLLHSAKATWDIIRHNRADIVHIQNGGNSPFAALLRLFGKRTYLSQDGVDWQRAKWPWYAKLYLWLSSLLTAYVHSEVIFDNIFAREYFCKRFRRKYAFVPFGADCDYDASGEGILDKLGLVPGGYFLFVGRFIPDKGVHYLIEAFRNVKTDKRLVLVGGSPNPSDYEEKIRDCNDPRVIFPGFVYGAETQALIKNCYAYIQPSDIEGLSPVILESAYLGAPIVCSDIEQNKYILEDDALFFEKSNPQSLAAVLSATLDDRDALLRIAAKGQARVKQNFSWDAVVDAHVRIFCGGGIETDSKATDKLKDAVGL